VTAEAPALSGDLVRAIARWTEQDPDPQTRRQLNDLAKAANSGNAPQGPNLSAHSPPDSSSARLDCAARSALDRTA
jgi:hypothetical protein